MLALHGRSNGSGCIRWYALCPIFGNPVHLGAAPVGQIGGKDMDWHASRYRPSTSQIDNLFGPGLNFFRLIEYPDSRFQRRGLCMCVPLRYFDAAVPRSSLTVQGSVPPMTCQLANVCRRVWNQTRCQRSVMPPIRPRSFTTLEKALGILCRTSAPLVERHPAI